MTETEDRERRRMARHSRQQARPFRVPLAEHPDNHFIYSDDLTRLTWKEAREMVAGFVLLTFVVVVVAFGMGLR